MQPRLRPDDGTAVTSADGLQAYWYGPRRPPWWTFPLAALYGGATAARRWMYRHRWLGSTRLQVPVIVVGNLVVGGAGKTPLTIALARALHECGWKPGVVSRGYGGSARAPTLLDARPDPAVVGDEPALIRLRTGLPVAVGADRVAAARLLLARDVNVIVADDGLQHYALARDLEICVIDGVRRFGNGHLLPAGPLREPVARLDTVDFRVCNGGESQANEIPMRLVPGTAVALGEPARTRPLVSFAGQRVHALAGIGHPPRFFAALRGLGLDVVEHPLPDHHRYAASNLAFGDTLPVLMTEKDAVKCQGFAIANAWSVPVSAELPSAFFAAIDERLNTHKAR